MPFVNVVIIRCQILLQIMVFTLLAFNNMSIVHNKTTQPSCSLSHQARCNHYNMMIGESTKLKKKKYFVSFFFFFLDRFWTGELKKYKDLNFSNPPDPL